MKKKLITIISALLAVVFTLGLFSGCELVSVDNQKDMAQVVAEVNVGKDEEAVAEALNVLGKTLDSGLKTRLSEVISTDEVYKRDLIVYFLSYGYSMVSQGQSYASVFSTLMDALVNQKLIIQLATVYYLNEGEVTVDRDFIDFKNGYTASSDSDAMTMDKQITVDGYQEAKADISESASSDAVALKTVGYFLTDDEKNYADYQVMRSINNAIDSYEQQIIQSQEDSSSSSGSDRTTPTGANQTEAFYPVNESGALDYDVYTGFNNINDCGVYKDAKVTGSTVVTRKKAYIKFISNLNKNYLLSEDEDISKIKELAYYSIELRSQYEQLLSDKFSASIALGMSGKITETDLVSQYNAQLQNQTVSSTDFVSTMDSVSDTSFALYSPVDKTFGFVYNILLPFSTSQSMSVKDFQSRYGSDTKEYYAARQLLFADIQATDQRSSWFNGSTDYSFDATEYGMSAGDDYFNNGSNYLFFKDSYVTRGNVETGKIDRYAGKYPYNGTVTKQKDGTYKLKANKIDIDAFIDEMEAYIGFATGNVGAASGSENTDFYTYVANDFVDSNNKIDYSKMIYYRGTVSGIGSVSAADYLVEEQASYQALSAVNELMFAYSTDTGCLNKYYGYSIASKDQATSYVKEFEYAAQEAIGQGAGTYYVVGTDYGWHIIYVSFVYTGGEVYGGFKYNERNDEGTFSYYFYQSVKTSIVENYQSSMNTDVMLELQGSDKAVVRYENRYKDLSSISA